MVTGGGVAEGLRGGGCVGGGEDGMSMVWGWGWRLRCCGHHSAALAGVRSLTNGVLRGGGGGGGAAAEKVRRGHGGKVTHVTERGEDCPLPPSSSLQGTPHSPPTFFIHSLQDEPEISV